jgi:hypothetical protein
MRHYELSDHFFLISTEDTSYTQFRINIFLIFIFLYTKETQNLISGGIEYIDEFREQERLQEIY